MSVPGRKGVYSNSTKSKSDNDRIKQLEEEMCLLRKEVEGMKSEREITENAIERAIYRGISALGGKYKVLVPEESGLNGSCCSEKHPERDSSTTSSTLSVTEWRKNNLSQVNKESGLICPEENNTSVSSSNSESKAKKNKDENCGNYQLG